ncbi:hypothetical protein WI42_25350 [Burkholderia ubonensis]|nr:hypothetical protein WI42_25350 [Burkholderia ubonensis]KVA21329.1 hypothetical protein WI43_01175 [Burkholderia ubonensis]KVA46264.1 hypothetical protein WI46_05915 [Burkholderia ubonensis]
MIGPPTTAPRFEMTHASIARIVVGSAGLDIDENHDDIAQAWDFLDSQIRQHESDVAIAFVRDDGEVFGTLLDLGGFHCYTETKSRFRAYLKRLQFYNFD